MEISKLLSDAVKKAALNSLYEVDADIALKQFHSILAEELDTIVDKKYINSYIFYGINLECADEPLVKIKVKESPRDTTWAKYLVHVDSLTGWENVESIFPISIVRQT